MVAKKSGAGTTSRQEASFDSGGVRIAYDVGGSGPPVLLVHGFAASSRRNWLETGMFDALVQSGRRVIALDCRGHGRSDKPHDQVAYSDGQMPQDLLRLLDHLQIERTDVFGYSMGAWMLLPLLAHRPDRFRAAVLGGAGAPLPETTALHAAILATFDGRELPAHTPAPDRTIATMFRAFAEATGNDIAALRCVLRSGVLRGDGMQDIEAGSLPVLLIAAKGDPVCGDPQALARTIPGSRVVLVPGTNHLSVMVAPVFRQTVLEFLASHGLRSSAGSP